MNAMTNDRRASAVPAMANSGVHAFAIGDLERMAKAIAKSGLFGIKTADQALALMLLAQAEGRHPATAARDYDIIEGRPAKKAEAMLRDFLAAGGAVEWLELTDSACRATFKHPSAGAATIEWTLQRAQKAGIAGDMWTRYPRQMLRCRVISEGVRTVCPMATSGLYVEAEMADLPHAAPSPANPMPSRAGRSDHEGATLPSFAAPAPSTAGQTDDVSASILAPHKKSARQLKAEGEDVRIQAEIDECDLAGLAQWEAEFSGRTGHLPKSWLDCIRDMIELRREEVLLGAAQSEMDEAFAATAAR